MTGVRDLVEPEGTTAVPVVGEQVRQRPGVNRCPRGSRPDLGDYLGQPLPGPERRGRVRKLAMCVLGTVLVPRHVGPEVGRVLVEVPGITVHGVRRQAALGCLELNAGRRVGGVDSVVSLTVVDPLEISGPVVRRAVDGGASAAGVVVGLPVVEVGDDVVVRVLDVVEVPPPCLVAVGVRRTWRRSRAHRCRRRRPGRSTRSWSPPCRADQPKRRLSPR